MPRVNGSMNGPTRSTPKKKKKKPVGSSMSYQKVSQAPSGKVTKGKWTNVAPSASPATRPAAKSVQNTVMTDLRRGIKVGTVSDQFVKKHKKYIESMIQSFFTSSKTTTTPLKKTRK